MDDNNLLEGLTVLAGDSGFIRKLKEERNNVPVVQPFAEKAILFLAKLGQELLHEREAKIYPDVVTLGFFCRKANIINLKKEYEGDIADRIGRGIVFHIAPSNVPVNFAYSLVAGLLSGNINVVKASGRDFIQVRIICRVLNRILTMAEFSDIRPYINVIMYNRDRQDITEYFSSFCNIRVIWGGDRTISTVRKAAIQPKAFDITFADRYSLAVIKPEAIIRIKEDKKTLAGLARDFYNDTYLYDQNACTSPHLIYWLGEVEKTDIARRIFWDAVYDNIKDRYRPEAETIINKLIAADKTAIEIPGSQKEESNDNKIVRVTIPRLAPELTELREAGGFFQEYTASSIIGLKEIVDERYQTVSYFGIDSEKLQKWVMENGLRGIDRIVPVGHTSDFSLIWDGYDLVKIMSRVVKNINSEVNKISV